MFHISQYQYLSEEFMSHIPQHQILSEEFMFHISQYQYLSEEFMSHIPQHQILSEGRFYLIVIPVLKSQIMLEIEEIKKHFLKEKTLLA